MLFHPPVTPVENVCVHQTEQVAATWYHSLGGVYALHSSLYWGMTEVGRFTLQPSLIPTYLRFIVCSCTQHSMEATRFKFN